jgi:hypothetical protein
MTTPKGLAQKKATKLQHQKLNPDHCNAGH